MKPLNQVTRVIKFRAWHKKYKLMFRVSSIMFDGKKYISSGEDLGALYDGLNSGEYHCEPETVELMQYTGLKDKAGKEIYEGDIVRGGTVKNKDGVKDMNLVVEYNRSVFEPIAYMIDDAIEVIGNIYENGDLL